LAGNLYGKSRVDDDCSSSQVLPNCKPSLSYMNIHKRWPQPYSVNGSEAGSGGQCREQGPGDRRLIAAIHLSPHGWEDGEREWGKNGLGEVGGH
jgi:hypothetical protein